MKSWSPPEADFDHRPRFPGLLEPIAGDGVAKTTAGVAVGTAASGFSKSDRTTASRSVKREAVWQSIRTEVDSVEERAGAKSDRNTAKLASFFSVERRFSSLGIFFGLFSSRSFISHSMGAWFSRS